MAFDLSSVSKTENDQPPMLCIYGPSGVGKTTTAYGAPNSIWLRTEDGTGLLEVDSFPMVKTWQDFMDALAALHNDQDFSTLVIDSLDHLEPLIWEAVCKDNGVDNIEKLGYGKGYVMALDQWREAFRALNSLRKNKGMTIVMIAHCEIIKFADPHNELIDRYNIKLHKKAAAFVFESCDAVLFAHKKFAVKTEQTGFGNTRARGINLKERVLGCEEDAGHLAKNRFNMPAEIPLSWDAIDQAINPQQKEQKNGTT